MPLASINHPECRENIIIQYIRIAGNKLKATKAIDIINEFKQR